MDGYIIVFNLPPKRRNVEISKFCQKFYGQDTNSWGGKYRYHRHGLLDNIPYRKLSRGVILIYDDDLETVLRFLERYNAHTHVRKVRLTEDDRKEMGK
ncbi:MAG: hypothetical protein HXS53_02880 [Theionarchaea archaeon]|nr:hypothetical protein [Theionarchaea archaeon]